MTCGVKTIHPALGRVFGDQVELAFAYSPGRGAPLVALHGHTASWVSFQGIAERLDRRKPDCLVTAKRLLRGSYVLASSVQVYKCTSERAEVIRLRVIG